MLSGHRSSTLQHRIIQTPGVRRVKIDVVDKSATTIDCSVLFLLPHLSSLKQWQTVANICARAEASNGLKEEAILFQLAGVPWLP